MRLGSTRRSTRALASLLALAFIALGTSCADQDLPDGQDVADIDLSPSAELVLGGDASADTTVGAAAVLLIRNDDADAHRLRGDGFDTGRLEPGDETLVTFPEPTTIEWDDELSDLSGTITVVAAD